MNRWAKGEKSTPPGESLTVCIVFGAILNNDLLKTKELSKIIR